MFIAAAFQILSNQRGKVSTSITETPDQKKSWLGKFFTL